MRSIPRLLLLAAALVLFPVSGVAQVAEPDPIAKDQNWVGLTLAVHREELDNTTSNLQSVIQGERLTWQVAPAYGRFLGRGTLLGARLEYSVDRSDVTTDAALGPNPRVERSIRAAGLAILTRSYLQLGESTFYLFNQTALSANFTWGTQATTTNVRTQSDVSGQRYALELQPGVAALIAEGFAVEASLNVLGLIYTTERVKTAGQPDSVKTTYDLDFSLNLLRLAISLTYYF